MRDRLLPVSVPQVMGIVNVTPDSFSDGGRYFSADGAVAHAQALIEEGATIIDVGGESTRPGAEPVPEDEELRRVIPVIERLRRVSDVFISIDTRRPSVMDAACLAGADMINDVQALQAEGALDVARRHRVAVCLMHMRGEPRTMQQAPDYVDVVAEVRAFLERRISACAAAGIAMERLVVDPGIGFGKRLDDNLKLLARLDRLAVAGRPVLIGASRKSMFAHLLDAPADRRLAGGLAVAALSAWQGAMIVRTHDVAATLDAVRTAAAIRDHR